MKTWVRRSLNVGVLGAGFLLVSGPVAAHADQVSGPNAGIGSGNQLSSVLQMPIDISGNAVSVLGFADASSVGGAGAVNTESASATEAGQVSGFNSGILSGNQVSSVVQVPVSVCGNSVAVLGFANASCVGGAGAVNGGGGGWSNGGWDNDGNGSGSGGYGGSNSGGYGGSNSGGYGDDSGDDSGYGGSNNGGYGQGGGRGSAHGSGHGSSWGHGAHDMGWNGREAGGALSNGGADQVTGYNAGIGSGNQVSSVIQAPIDVSGNAIALFGFASASSVGGAGAVNESASTTEAGQVSGFNAGVLTGNQISSVVQVPISVCGNSIAILGFADASCVGGAGAVNGGGGMGNGGGHWTPPADDDNADNSGDPYDYADPSATGRPMASAHGAHKATSKAAKKANKKSHNGEHGNWGGAARGHHGTSAGASGYGGAGNGGYNGGGAGNGNGGNGGSWGGNGGSCGPDQITGFNSGILSGNQVSNVVQLPVDISGNAISVLGFASASSVGGAAAVNC